MRGAKLRSVPLHDALDIGQSRKAGGLAARVLQMLVPHVQPGVSTEHYGQPGQGMVLEAGMIFTIEPMLNAGKAATRELADGWTVITNDKSLSAQWEHMVVVTDTGFDVLTRWPEGTGNYAAI